MKRTLTLKSESLAELTPADLTVVVGAGQYLSRTDGKCTFDNTYIFCTNSCVA